MENDTKILALLEAANRSSEQVSVLHIAFMALCAYVLVIVFSTIDMDLFLGKGLKLTGVNTEVRITSFYAFAPYLVVLVHFNLLLQLQLLSRKLYAFDDAINNSKLSKEALAGLRNRLHIFPYTYYLVGNSDPIVHFLLIFMVITTLLLLPLATLLALQLWFLAYQNHVITWAQRVAVWLDVAFIIILWPVIMDRHDSWCKYMHAIVSRLCKWWGMALIGVAAWASFIVVCLVSNANVFNLMLPLFLGLFVLLVLFSIVKAMEWNQRPYPNGMSLEAPGRGQLPVHGLSVLLLTVGIALPLSLALLVDGEPLDAGLESLLGGSTFASSKIYQSFRQLDLTGQILLAKPAKPEMIMELLRESDSKNVTKALKQVEGVSLEERSLRHANLSRTLLISANLRRAHLEGAKLWDVDLRGANLPHAHLRGTKLANAQLQGANLYNAQLQGTDWRTANLQGTDWRTANLQGTDWRTANLQGTDLRSANLRGIVLTEAPLMGKGFLAGVQLKEATTELIDLRSAYWKEYDLRLMSVNKAEDLVNKGRDLIIVAFVGTDLHIRIFDTNGNIVVDMTEGELIAGETLTTLKNRLIALLDKSGLSPEQKQKIIREAILIISPQSGLSSPTFDSCFIDEAASQNGLCCNNPPWPSLEVFQSKLYPILESLACKEPSIARGLINQINFNKNSRTYDLSGSNMDSNCKSINLQSSRFGLAEYFEKMLNKRECKGLYSLPEDDKNLIHNCAKRENELKWNR